jgi:uroporphyrinogen decarboxylase
MDLLAAMVLEGSRMSEMTKRERIKAAVACGDVDRVPFSFWYHFLEVEDKAGEEFIGSEIAFAEKYDVDFLKVMHDIPYDMPPSMPVIREPADWRRLEPLDVRTGNFGRHLDALRRIREGLPDDRPMVDTFFHCFAYAQRICTERPLALQHLAEDPEAFGHGLTVIGETLKSFAAACIEDGILDGIFLAINAIGSEFMDEATYREVCMPIDHDVLQTAIDAGGWFNVAHLHGLDIHFDAGMTLPHNVLNWSDRTTPPSLAEAREKTDSCLLGGINETNADRVTPEDIKAQVREAIAQLGGKGLVVTCGCAVPTPTPEANLFAVKEAILEG